MSCCLWLAGLARTKLLSMHLASCYKKEMMLCQAWQETSPSPCPSSSEEHINCVLCISLLAGAQMNKRKVGVSHAAPAAGLGRAMQWLAHHNSETEGGNPRGVVQPLRADLFSPQTGEQIWKECVGLQLLPGPKGIVQFLFGIQSHPCASRLQLLSL